MSSPHQVCVVAADGSTLPQVLFYAVLAGSLLALVFYDFSSILLTRLADVVDRLRTWIVQRLRHD